MGYEAHRRIVRVLQVPACFVLGRALKREALEVPPAATVGIAFVDLFDRAPLVPGLKEEGNDPDCFLVEAVRNTKTS